jgi:hypothetical protein
VWPTSYVRRSGQAWKLVTAAVLLFGGVVRLGLLRAAKRFRRITRHGELGALVTELGEVATAGERAA